MCVRLDVSCADAVMGIVTQIAKAVDSTGLPRANLVVADIQDPGFLEREGFPRGFIGACDKVFTSAALHWCARDPQGPLQSAWRLLKPGGRLVGEMGGAGNVAGACFSYSYSTGRGLEG